jgi:thioesterase domain-containing protein/acyl carrier protein
MQSTTANIGSLRIHQNDDIQKILIDALEAVLKVKPSEIDTAKNFDEYGLDSIDAVIATEWIGQRLGIALPPEFLFLFRNIDAVMNALLTGEYRQASSHHQPSSQIPIFFFPGGGGVDESPLIRFRERASSELIFEVLQIGKWYDWVDRKLKFEDLAALAAQYINTKSPHGPIKLGGYSQGGQLAYVTALALQEMGRTVELLAVLDSNTNVIERGSVLRPAIFWAVLSLLRDYIVVKLRGRRMFPEKQKLVYFLSWLWDQRGGPELIMGMMRIERRFLPGKVRVRGDGFVQMRIFATMWSDWTEKAKMRSLQNTSVILFRSEDPGPPDRGWGSHCKNVKVVLVKGDHYSILSSDDLVDRFVAEVA